MTFADAATVSSDMTPVRVKPWGSEIPLKIVMSLMGLLLWAAIAISIFPLVYALFIAVILFFSHVVLIAHIRGSAVKLGPDQMPGLYQRVVALCGRFGTKVPDIYLMQSNGVLNAFATKLGSRRFIVLHSDILAACGSDTDALDFVIAHEIGHLDRGHLSWRWLRAPAYIVPFLGAAYSRACEHTCDRYGAAVCSAPQHAANALALLAASKTYAPAVNMQAFVGQEETLETSLMKIGCWLSFYPSLARRVRVLVPDLRATPPRSHIVPTVGALLIVLLWAAVPAALIYGAVEYFYKEQERFSQAGIMLAPDAGMGDQDAAPDNGDGVQIPAAPDQSPPASKP
ncbi:MAG: M48 family metallopeptidase [Alphaproteobacteria bacterium]|nr:M48 family metallopeptidase [Alphaproteobacteria bacterium]